MVSRETARPESVISSDRQDVPVADIGRAAASEDEEVRVQGADDVAAAVPAPSGRLASSDTSPSAPAQFEGPSSVDRQRSNEPLHLHHAEAAEFAEDTSLVSKASVGSEIINENVRSEPAQAVPPLSTPRFDASPHLAPVAARPESVRPVVSNPSVDDDHEAAAARMLPDRQYATADALGLRVESDSRVHSTGLPEVRMSTSNDHPSSTESEAPAISVSVTRPWLEVDPAPGFRAQREAEAAAASKTMSPPSGSQPLIESISLMDDSTPLALEVAEDTRRRIALAGRRFPRPKDTRVITVSNQKGGVGKTTTTVNMAAALAQAGLRVLVLDIDPQGNASTALGIDHHADVPSVYDVLVEGRPLREVVQACPDIENLWCAPATIDLAGAEIELVSLVARESRLQRAVSAYLLAQGKGEDRLDYILIDCPPSLGLLTVNAFVAAHEVLIPIQCEYYALEGLSQLLRNVELIRGHLNTALHVSTILLTMYDGRTRLSSQVADEVRSHFPSEVLKTTVPRSVRISEAPSHGQTVMTYDPASSGALSYLEAARELAEQVLGTSDDEVSVGERS